MSANKVPSKLNMGTFFSTFFDPSKHERVTAFSLRQAAAHRCNADYVQNLNFKKKRNANIASRSNKPFVGHRNLQWIGTALLL